MTLGNFSTMGAQFMPQILGGGKGGGMGGSMNPMSMLGGGKGGGMGGGKSGPFGQGQITTGNKWGDAIANMFTPSGSMGMVQGMLKDYSGYGLMEKIMSGQTPSWKDLPVLGGLIDLFV